MKRVRKNEAPQVVIQLGAKIKSIIKNKGLKQRDVAHDAGIDVENLRKYIKGVQEMRVSTVFRIAEALAVTASELLEDLDTKSDK